MKIDAEVFSIKNLDKYYFVVPDYQREYVWEADKHIYQFLVDIDEEFDAHSIEQQSYFLGSIIIVKKDSKYDVIDGQQRLTTIVLCLCAIRNILESLRDKEPLSRMSSNMLDITKNWLYTFDMEAETTMPRLELQYDDSNGYLDTMIQKLEYENEVTSSIDKMKKAYDRILEHFKSYIQQDIKIFEKYAKYFLTSVNVVVIESDNLGSALKIFETINQRGAGLNAMDLVKNLLFSKAKDHDFEVIKTKWKQITSDLQSCDEGDKPLRFLRYFMIARYHNGIIREDDLYSWIISKEGKSKLDYENEPLNLVNEMVAAAKRYSYLVQATNSDTNAIGVNKYPNVVNIGYINKQRSRQHLILLMALNLNCDDDVINYLAQQIESFLFFANTLKMQTKNYERRFTDWAIKLRGMRSVEEIVEIIDETMIPYLRGYLSDFRYSFLQIRHYDYNPQYRERYILGCLDTELCIQAGLNPLSQDNIQRLQIEHILPQTLTNLEADSDFTNDEDREKYTYMLGNTTLLESQINQAINNYNNLSTDWFAMKQTEYIHSNFVLTKLLNDQYTIGKNTGLNRLKSKLNCQFDEWTKTSIKQRQQMLMELSFDHWQLNGKRLDEYDRASTVNNIEI
ncbi:DUF262 domain-containing protein [Psychrobacter sp. 1U2]|uniref:DUF262 domain-containing protein n=1 Tax=Psychrobacter sp. 1U2 TaxID=3453577 RepID=UPI003F473828